MRPLPLHGYVEGRADALSLGAESNGNAGLENPFATLERSLWIARAPLRSAHERTLPVGAPTRARGAAVDWLRSERFRRTCRAHQLRPPDDRFQIGRAHV